MESMLIHIRKGHLIAVIVLATVELSVAMKDTNDSSQE
jgi:hypothetical protein